jgi:hypothetical protein
LNATHRFLVYVDVNLLGETINTIKRDTEVIYDISKQVCLETNIEKIIDTSSHKQVSNSKRKDK